MKATQKCVLEFTLPEERYRIQYALKGEDYYHLIHEIGEIIHNSMKMSPCLQVVDIWEDVRKAAEKKGVVLY